MTSSWAPLRLRTAAATTHSSSSLLIPNSQRLRHLRFSGTTVRPSSSHLALQVGASYLRDGRRPGMLRSRLRQLLGRWLIYTLEARLVEDGPKYEENYWAEVDSYPKRRRTNPKRSAQPVSFYPKIEGNYSSGEEPKNWRRNGDGGLTGDSVYRD
nr:hypothetical protein Iba_chr01fCG0270 [Ipomoea batatas]